MKLSYAPDLFVGRERLLEKITAWATDPSPRFRLWSIIGPPGVGKTWLLAQIKERLQHKQDQLVFWLDLAEIHTENDEQAAFSAFLIKWLQDTISNAKQQCGEEANHIRSFDPTVPFEAMFDSFAFDLCSWCRLKQPAILIVDSFDEVKTQQTHRELEERVLTTFLARDCTRILLARGDEDRLTNHGLRWNERVERLSVFDKQLQEELEQLSRLKNHLGVKEEQFDLTELNQAIPIYDWNYPAINAELLNCALRNRLEGKSFLLNHMDLKNCLRNIVQPDQLSDEGFNLLVQLAHMDGQDFYRDKWTDLDLRDSLNKRPEDLEELLSLGIVFRLPGEPFSKVVDGIRELVRAWKIQREG